MKVIELLAKIANGEETHFDTKLNDKSVSVRYYNDRNFSSSTDPEMLTIADIIKSLNDEVEIIEEADEIERPNYIINEIERFVKNCIEYNSKCNSTIYEARAFEDSVILHKIKELKGENKQ